MKKKNKKKTFKISIEGEALDAFLGKLAREIYLSQNPHGFASINKKHKNKKKYNRKKIYGK